MNIIEDIKSQYKTGGIVQKLIFWNIGLYLLSLIFFYNFSFGNFDFPSWLALYSNFDDFIFSPWTLFTYMFLHAGFLHLLFNMMVLHFSGRLFEAYFTQKQLFGLYILGGIFSGIAFLVSFLLVGKTSVLVGASGAIMALLIATATYAPFMQIRLMLIGVVKLWQVAFVIVLLDLIQLPLDNSGGHLAHLAGALFGFLYVKMLNSGTDLSKLISSLQEFFENLLKPKKKTPFKKVHKNKPNPSSTSFTKKEKSMDQKKIDDILDRISQSGYDSLTKEEKEFLFKVGK
ncbi:rhomboid family intramembrane serine protease [Flavobacterium sp.]|jgi:membrane associated rhomboid family serine protease|uniref:rhomboid family intramembrane serine protease n=1 Tax=Flavobacterium sp. TaxID=239 RepID=UPI002A82DA5B|nr:rhomboid family intramembrane serine protease [Flavobacterium sp.]